MGLRFNTFIDIIERRLVKDTEGFSQTVDEILASVRAYKEDRHATVAWANRAAFSNATALYRFRVIPGVVVKPGMIIACEDGRYRVLSVENVKNRNMYIETLAEKIESI